MVSIQQAIPAKYIGSLQQLQQQNWTSEQWEAYERKREVLANATPGHLTGYDCRDCMNRGFFMRYNSEAKTLVSIRCRCMGIRAARQAMATSGLSPAVLDGLSWEKWQTQKVWQQRAMDAAKNYAHKVTSDKDFSGWFIMSGNPGCGKTMLCSILFKDILERGKRGRYVSWRDFARKAKAVANDGEKFQAIIQDVKNAPVLYLDDLMKSKVTEADMGLIFEILNTRYAEGKPTIISSELTVEAVLSGDEAIGSRMFERSRGFYINCSEVENWRINH